MSRDISRVTELLRSRLDGTLASLERFAIRYNVEPDYGAQAWRTVA